MKILTIVILITLSACTTNKNNQVSLENKQWEPVNKNYMNKKDF